MRYPILKTRRRSSDRAVVPVSGEVVLAWGVPAVEGSQTVLPGHSFAILRTTAKG